jgi:drug/metabolite transporter (DMT)-like permease
MKRWRGRMLPVALVTMWLTTGGNFLGFKTALESIPPFLMMCTRLLAAGAIFLLLSGLDDEPRRATPRQLGSVAIASALLLVLGQGAIVWGVRSLPAGTAAVFTSSSPLFLALFSWVLAREPLGARAVIGILLGFVGLVVMALAADDGGRPDPFGIACVLFGAASWAAGSLHARAADTPPNLILAAALQMLLAGAAMFLLAALAGELGDFEPRRSSARSLAGLAYLIVFGLVIGFGAFMWLNRAASPGLANTFYYVSPVVAMFAGALLLGETLTWAKGLAAVVALAGVALMISGRSAGRPRSAHDSLASKE